MESFVFLLIILLSVIVVVFFACRAIYGRKRQQQAQESQPTEVKYTPQTFITPPEQTIIAQKDEPVEEEEKQPPVGEESQPIAPDEPPQPPTLETPLIMPRRTEQIEAKKDQAEARLPVTTEALPFGAEEARSKPSGEAMQLAADQAQPADTKATPLKQKRKRPKPSERGGRPRDSTRDHEIRREHKTRIRTLKPEIVCWKRERQWLVAVEVPEELLGNPDLTVLQNGSTLPKEDSEETRWRLEQMVDEVIVRWNEAEAVREAKVELGQDGYLLFKLGGRNLDQGRLVKSPSLGSYLAIAPEAWERDEELSGLPPAMPEPVSFVGCKAHFFDFEESGKKIIAFRRPDGQSLVIESKAPRFKLVGKQLEDSSEHIGPLFGEMPPQIRALDAQTWKDIETIIVGEEGGGKGKWRDQFSPILEQVEQDVLSPIGDRKSGWYFLRFYDHNGDLVESLDFRFVGSLKEIRLPKSSPLPPKGGHEAVCVEFIHSLEFAIRPADTFPLIQTDCQGERTILTIPPDPECEQSRWFVCSNNGSPVEVTILVERVWWALAGEDHTPSQWTDKPLTLSREDFAATSSKALWVRLPKYHWLDKVLVGFEQSKARPYNVKATEQTVAIPLREFSDCAEVGNRTQEYSLRLWIKRDDQDEGVLALLPASQPATIPMFTPAGLPPIQSWVGFGRKKTAIAKAVIQNGAAKIEVNGRGVDEYFRQTPRRAKQFLERLLDLKEVREVLSRLEVKITIEGSSPTTLRQAKAATHAIARALMRYDHNLTAVLKQAGFGGIIVKQLEASRRDEQ